MEDAFVISEISMEDKPGLIVCVFDGHGGTEVVNILSSQFLRHFKQALASTKRMVETLLDAFRLSEQAVMNGKVGFGGSTACVCFLTTERLEPVLYTAHLGDTRAVLCRSGEAIRLTSLSDHKATDPLEKERILLNGGTVYNDRVRGMLAISRAFGDNVLKHIPPEDDPKSLIIQPLVSAVPDITSVILDPERDSFVIIACDGLWDVVSDQEACNIVIECLQTLHNLWDQRQYGPCSAVAMAEILAQCLTEEALSRGTTDNVTCVLVFIYYTLHCNSITFSYILISP